MTVSAREKLRRFLDLFSGEDHVLVPIVADPDAIASAMTVKRLLWRRVASVTIANVNKILRPDNLAMVRLLSVGMVPFGQIAPERFSRVVMVDAQPNHHPAFDPLDITAIFDHHPDTGHRAAFTDIRPAYGAVSTMMTEYLKAARIKPSSKLATGLYLGIKTDTANFERQALIEDVRAFQFLFRYTNTALARRIEQAEIKRAFLKFYQKAIETHTIRKARCYVHLGPVPSPDLCVLIADFFMHLDSITWSIVSGIYHDRLIVIFRNDGLRKNAGLVAKESFGPWGKAGGHKSAARAEAPLEKLSEAVDPGDQAQMRRWIIRRIEQRATYAKKRKPGG